MHINSLYSPNRISPAFSGHGYLVKQIREYKESGVQRDLCQVFSPSLLRSQLLTEKENLQAKNLINDI